MMPTLLLWCACARQVEFDGPYPLEGAKGVRSAATRHLARLVRHCPTPTHPMPLNRKDRERLAPVLRLVVQGDRVVAEGPLAPDR